MYNCSLTLGETINVKIKSNVILENYHLVVKSGPKILKHQLANMDYTDYGKEDRDFDLELTDDMKDGVEIFCYYISDGELIYDTLKLKISNSIKNSNENLIFPAVVNLETFIFFRNF